MAVQYELVEPIQMRTLRVLTANAIEPYSPKFGAVKSPESDEESPMTHGKTIAMAVAGLLLTAGPTTVSAGDAKTATVKCEGINTCKGKGACSTATNGCAGLNECKGKGWVTVTAKECKAKKGKVIAEPKPTK
jgi:hypothetical protein